MTKYLHTKPGSIEELAAKMSSKVNEGEYQQIFKKELDKAGKGIGSMTPAEKKAFFNKIDSKYKAKDEEIKEAVDNPYAVGMAQAMKKTGDKPPLKKSTITKAHDIAKSIEKDEKKEEVEEAKVNELTAAQKKLPPALQKAIKKKEDAKEEVNEARQRRKIGPGGGGSIEDAEIETIERTNDRLSPPETSFMGNSYDPTQKEEK